MVLKEFCVVADGGGSGGGVAFFRQSTLSVDDLSQQPWSEFMMVMTLCHSVQVGLRPNTIYRFTRHGWTPLADLYWARNYSL